MLEQMGFGTMALKGEKVSPNVDFFSLALVDEGMNVGPRDKVLCLSLDFQVARMSSFSSIRSASVALKSFSELRHRASFEHPICHFPQHVNC